MSDYLNDQLRSFNVYEAKRVTKTILPDKIKELKQYIINELRTASKNGKTYVKIKIELGYNVSLEIEKWVRRYGAYETGLRHDGIDNRYLLIYWDE